MCMYNITQCVHTPNCVSVSVKQWLVPTNSLQDTQYVEEEVDEVQIQADRGQHILLRRQPVHDQVGIK